MLRRMTRWSATCGALLLLHVTCGVARAEPPPPAPAKDAEIDARLAFLERAIERERDSTRLWYDGWTGFFGAAALAQAGLAANVTTYAARVAGIAGAAKAGLGFGFMLVSPAGGRTAADLLRAMPAATPSQRLAKLRRAEAMLSTIATEERFRRSWFPTLGGGVVNLGGAVAVFALTHDAGAGWLGLASGLLVSGLHRFTAPTAAIGAWDAYRRGDLRAPPPRPRVSIEPSATGILMRGWF